MRRYHVAKAVLCLFVAVASLFSLCSCDLSRIFEIVSPSETSSFGVLNTVTFVCDGELYGESSQILYGGTATAPADPVKNNRIFVGWFRDAGCTEKFYFSEKIYSDLTLYAGFRIDGAAITNEITSHWIRSTVTVYNKSYNTQIVWGKDTGVETESVMSQGSGVIFLHENGKYYLLTNCHVARKRDGYAKQSFTVEDYLGNVYTATLCKNPENDLPSISAGYDLACLEFRDMNKAKLETVKFAESDPAVRTEVISVGTPMGQKNAVTFGVIRIYKTAELIDSDEISSDVDFEVIYHNAFIDSGSSGSVLFNADMELVGVNYAGANEEDKHLGLAIPVERVKEFLNHYFSDRFSG